MEEFLKTINEFLLSINPDIYRNFFVVIVGLIVVMLIGSIIYDFFKKAGEKFDTTPLGAFFIILTLPISIPVVILWNIVKLVYIFLKPYLKELLFLTIGLFKILIRVISAIIQLGKGNTSNLEMNVLTLTGSIITLENELVESKAKRKEILDSIAASLGSNFDISDLHSALIILLHTMFEHQGFDKELLANHAVKSTLETSAERIHNLLMNDFLSKEYQPEDDFNETPF